ncbi:MAG TPA: MFS transporter, partial [Chloroflexota bacterium]|nr:MFS transporter [Chloroflexota bacterium]
LQALGVLLMAETSARRPGAIAALRPRFALPAAARRPFLVAVPVLVATWSLAGLYGSLGPALVRQLVGANSFVLAGLALFVLAGSGAMAVLFLRTAAPRTMLILGTVALLTGVGSTMLAISYTSAACFFIGTAVAGVGFGAAFQGAIRTVLPLAGSHERAGVLSLLYVVSYLAMGLPAVIAGFLVVHGGGVRPTAREYGLAVMVLAALALVAEIRPRGRHAPALPAPAPARGTIAPGAQPLCSSRVPADQRPAGMAAASPVCGKAVLS